MTRLTVRGVENARELLNGPSQQELYETLQKYENAIEDLQKQVCKERITGDLKGYSDISTVKEFTHLFRTTESFLMYELKKYEDMLEILHLDLSSAGVNNVAKKCIHYFKIIAPGRRWCFKCGTLRTREPDGEFRYSEPKYLLKEDESC